MRAGFIRGDMKITVLVENATPSSRLAACHGLSLLVETAGRRILFDVGPDATLLANARALDVDIACVDAVVISHGHADHGGGLGAYLEATQGSHYAHLRARRRVHRAPLRHVREQPQHLARSRSGESSALRANGGAYGARAGRRALLGRTRPPIPRRHRMRASSVWPRGQRARRF